MFWTTLCTFPTAAYFVSYIIFPDAFAKSKYIDISNSSFTCAVVKTALHLFSTHAYQIERPKTENIRYEYLHRYTPTFYHV